MSATIALSYTTRRGACVVAYIRPDELEARVLRLYARRLEAEAWKEPDREHIVAQVFKRDGRWLWWVETNP